MGFLDTIIASNISNPYMIEGQDHSIIKDWAKEHPYAAASIATMPLPITSAVLGMKADYDMYKNYPETRKWYNFGLSGLGLLPIIPPASAVLKSASKGNLLHDAKNIAQDVKATASNIKQGAQNLFDVNNYGTPSYGILSNNLHQIPPIKPDSASKNYLGMFVGKKDPRYKDASSVAGDAFRAGKSDAEIFKESGMMRQPQGIWKAGDDLENALEVTDSYKLNPYLTKKYNEKLLWGESTPLEKVDFKYIAIRSMTKDKARSEVINSPIYKEYKELPTLRDLFQGKDFDDLLKAYPEIGNTKIDLNLDPKFTDVNGSFYQLSGKNADLFSPTIQMNASSVKDAIAAIKHEMQHNIQLIEGWTKGGSANVTTIRSRLDKNVARLPDSAQGHIYDLSLAYRNLERNIRRSPRWADKYEQEFLAIINPIRNSYKNTELFNRVDGFAQLNAGLGSSHEITRNRAAMEAYFRLGGEVQARTTQFRSNLSMGDRLNTNPYHQKPEGHFLGDVKTNAGETLKRLLFAKDKTLKPYEQGSPNLGTLLDASALREPRFQYPPSHIID